jgi:PDZ domain-containing protein
MTTRALTLTVSSALLALLVSVAFLVPVPYVTESPGLTADVLGNDISADGQQTDTPVITIDGDVESYPTSGELLLTTVSVTNPDSRVTLLQALGAWFDEEDALLPRDVVYPPDQSADEVREETAVAMTGSQSTSEVAAADAAGYEVTATAGVAEVAADGPSDGKLEVDDQILAVGGQPVEGSAELIEAVRASTPGEALPLLVRRGDTRRVIDVVPQDDDGRTAIGISVGDTYSVPFDVEFNLERDIGGPSAGTIFALAIYDKLTPGELTGGLVVAGTGEMDYDGTVGPIGGIQQKIVSSAEDGASVFLAPADNCDDALAAPVESDEIQILRIGTLDEAIDALETLAEDPDADVPTCEAT